LLATCPAPRAARAAVRAVPLRGSAPAPNNIYVPRMCPATEMSGGQDHGLGQHGAASQGKRCSKEAATGPEAAAAERQPNKRNADGHHDVVKDDPGNSDDLAMPASPTAPGQRALDYGAIYAAANESNIHLRHWICDIYDLHGLPQDPQLSDAPYRSALHSPTLRSLRLLLSVRRLILELWNFQAIYSHYGEIKKGLDVKKTSGLTMIIKDHKVVGSLKRLRDQLAHQGITLEELANEINSLGLAPLVHYARAVLMFEDAVYRTVKNSNYRQKNTGWDPAGLTLKMPGSSDRDAFAKKYSAVNFTLNPEHSRDYILMGELRLSLLMLYTGLVESAQNTANRTLDSYLRFTGNVYNAKYMILDIHNFIAKFKKLGLQDAVEPAFLSRECLYRSLRNNYSAHTKITKVRTIESVIDAHPDLLGHMLLDILEIDALASGLLRRFETTPARQISPMSREQIDKIDEAMRVTRLESHGRLGHSYIDPNEEKKRLEIRAVAKRRLGLR